MARRKTTLNAEITSATEGEASATATDAPVKRRRRRTTANLQAETASETTTLVEAVLRSRGAKGATQETIQSVIAWSRDIRTEGDALRELANRPRRQKTQAPADRVARYEMNRALLEGVLTGSVLLDLRDDGSFVFLHRDAAASAAAVEALPTEVPVEYPEE